jgi:hypothetical protein
MANLDLKKCFQRFLQLAALPENAGDPILLRLAMELRARDVPELFVRLCAIAEEAERQRVVGDAELRVMWSRVPSKLGNQLSMVVAIACVLFVILSPIPWYMSIGYGWFPALALFWTAKETKQDSVPKFYCGACGHDIERERLIIHPSEVNSKCANCGSRLHVNNKSKLSNAIRN